MRQTALVLAPALALALAASPGLAQETTPAAVAPGMEMTAPSNFVEVDGVSMHYVEAGEGAPVVLLHGNPTSSYLWRNVIPPLAENFRVIAPDLVGFGRSDKPDIDYTLQSHQPFVDGFIEALGLTDVTLVVHDWGSVLGLTYAMTHQDNVRAVAFMEAIIPPVFPMSSLEAMGPYADTFRAFRTPETGRQMIIEHNVFIEELLPQAVLRPLHEAEMDAYRAPFTEVATREPIYVWPNEIPIGGEPARNVEAIEALGAWLATSETPKLAIYFEPGALMPRQAALAMAENFANTDVRYGGAGLHYVQEDEPLAIARHVADWLQTLD